MVKFRLANIELPRREAPILKASFPDARVFTEHVIDFDFLN